MAGGNFKRAATEFYRQERWFDDSNRRVMTNPWQIFADNVLHYLREAELHDRDLAAKAAAERSAEEQMAAEFRAAAKKRRWATVQDCLTITWPGMPAEDSNAAMPDASLFFVCHLNVSYNIGPGEWNRTITAFRPHDFESCASASSATPG
jgi:hypothetical protein